MSPQKQKVLNPYGQQPQHTGQTPSIGFGASLAVGAHSGQRAAEQFGGPNGQIYGDQQDGHSLDTEVKPSGNILFVEKLHRKTEVAALSERFSLYGTLISAEIARDPISGDSLRYAFIEFMTKESCEHANRMMGSAIIDGRKIRVSIISHECRERKRNTNKGGEICNYPVATEKKRLGLRGKGKDEAVEEVAHPPRSVRKRKVGNSDQDAEEGAYAEEQSYLGEDEVADTVAKQLRVEADTVANQLRVEGDGSLPDAYRVSESELDNAMGDRGNNRRVGSGSFGTVFRLILNGQDVAVKFLNEMSADPKEQARSLRAFDSEVNVLSRLKHRNLVQLIGVCKPSRAIVYEFLPNGNLYERMHVHARKFGWMERLSAALDISSALLYLQDREDPVVHGDITPANVLFDGTNVAKLGDFGISRILVTTTPSGSTKMHRTNNTPTGTPDYVDPEYKRTSKLTPASDIFALGIILMQLVSGQGAEGLRELVHQTLANKMFWEDQGPEDKEHMIRSLKKVKLIDTRINLPDIMDGLELLKLGMDCTWTSSKRRAQLQHVVSVLRSLSERSMLPGEVKDGKES